MTAADPSRPHDLKRIHAMKRELALDDAAYRALLERATGRRSAADLDVQHRAMVVAELTRLRTAASAPHVTNFVALARADQRFALRLWHDLHELGEVEAPGIAALNAFVERQTGVATLQWVAPEHLAPVLEALKAWCGRVGFAPAPRGSKDAASSSFRALARAQWARLEALGAVAFRNAAHRVDALDAYFTKHAARARMSLDQGRDVELRVLVRRLGRWIRAAKAKSGAA